MRVAIRGDSKEIDCNQLRSCLRTIRQAVFEINNEIFHWTNKAGNYVHSFIIEKLREAGKIEISGYLLADKIKTERYEIQWEAFVKDVEELNRSEKLLGKSASVKRVDSMVYSTYTPKASAESNNKRPMNSEEDTTAVAVSAKKIYL